MAEMTGIITASGRTLEEIRVGIRIRMQSMVNSALDIGIDLMEAKEACRHGEWLPFLKGIGLSASTAANYMRIAKEVSADSRVAQLPYTKILALLAAPPEEREELAAAAEDMSAAEIRRLTEERNRAAEAANTETARADQAEEKAKEYYDEIASLRTKNQSLQHQLDDERQHHKMDSDDFERMLKEAGERSKEAEMRVFDLRGKLLHAENNRVEVEVPPADYEELKRNQQELLNAAADAEERANAAEAELERIQAGSGGFPAEKPVGIVLGQAMNAFMRECEMMPFDPAQLQRDRYAVTHCISMLHGWCVRMEEALGDPVITEANVI